jgi:hypothetical protein
LWEHPVYQLHLNEWQRPELLSSHARYLILGPLGAWVLYKGRAQRWEWLLSGAFYALGFLGWRHGTLAALVLCHTAGPLLPTVERSWSKTTRAALFLVGITVAGYLGLQRFGAGPHGWALLDSHFPTRTAQILKTSPELPNRIINPYEWGGYLAWEIGPSLQTYIDGRAHTLFSDQTYLDSLVLQFGGTSHEVSYLKQESRREILDELNAELVLATRLQGKQIEWMSLQPDWLLLYEDQVSALYLKKSGETLSRVAGRLGEAKKAVAYARLLQDTPFELLFLKRAVELAPDPESREQLLELQKTREAEQSGV